MRIGPVTDTFLLSRESGRPNGCTGSSLREHPPHRLSGVRWDQPSWEELAHTCGGPCSKLGVKVEGVLRPAHCRLEGWLDFLAVQLLQEEQDRCGEQATESRDQRPQAARTLPRRMMRRNADGVCYLYNSLYITLYPTVCVT